MTRRAASLHKPRLSRFRSGTAPHLVSSVGQQCLVLLVLVLSPPLCPRLPDIATARLRLPCLAAPSLSPLPPPHSSHPSPPSPSHSLFSLPLSPGATATMRPVCARLAAVATAVAVAVTAAAVPLPAAAQRVFTGRGAPLVVATPTTAPTAAAAAAATAAATGATTTAAVPPVSTIPRGALLGLRPSSAPFPAEEQNRDVTKPPPPAATDVAACLAAYLAAPVENVYAIPAYLCCVDPSMGFCDTSLEFRANREVCSLDTSERRGGQCCFSQPEDGTRAGDGGTPLAVRCTSLLIDSPCRECTRAGAPGCADRPGKCTSLAADRYSRCDVGVCVVRGRRARVMVRPTWCGWFGTVAQCCLMKKMWWERVKCCRECRVPGWGRKSWGCCWAGPRPW